LGALGRAGSTDDRPRVLARGVCPAFQGFLEWLPGGAAREGSLAARLSELLGIAGDSFTEPSLTHLVGRGRAGTNRPGPVGRTVVELDEGRLLPCVTLGLFLVSEGESRLAVPVGRRRHP